MKVEAMKNFRTKNPPEAALGFYGSRATRTGVFAYETFTLAVFEIEAKNGGGFKRGKTLCRVKQLGGSTLGLELAKETAELVCQVLEKGRSLPQKMWWAGIGSDARLRDLLS